MFKRFLAASALALALAAIVAGPAEPAYVPQQFSNATAQVNQTGVATTQVIGLVAGSRILISGWNITTSGAGSVQWVTGTGANCGTGQSALTPAMAISASFPFNLFGNGTAVMLTVPSGQALCLITTGAGIVYTGLVTYLQGQF